MHTSQDTGDSAHGTEIKININCYLQDCVCFKTSFPFQRCQGLKFTGSEGVKAQMPDRQTDKQTDIAF